MYTGGGNNLLIDGITGTANWKTGDWQSYYDTDFTAVIDLQQTRPINYVGVHVLQELSPWIIFPGEVIFEVSNDGKNFTLLIKVVNTVTKDKRGPSEQGLGSNVKAIARFIRVVAKNGGKLPAWHESAGSPSHIFIDEVIVK